jgi:hypothetical protein
MALTFLSRADIESTATVRSMSIHLASRPLHSALMPKPCVFLSDARQLVRLTETELWGLFDEIQRWRTSGRGQLSSAAEAFLAGRYHSAKCREVFELWQMRVRAPVC